MNRILYLLRSGVLCLAMVAAASANMGTEESDSSDPNFQEGRKAVEAQNWNAGIDLLAKAVQADPGNADAQNLLGYAYRQTGNYDAAFRHYGEALKADPQHKHAHEYIGEAYLLTGNLARAEHHLAELQRICTPIPCEEYRELKRAVDDYKKKRN